MLAEPAADGPSFGAEAHRYHASVRALRSTLACRAARRGRAATPAAA
jgi:hypothetical protein